MIVVQGRQVFTELHEIVDPAHTALVIVDVQNDFCSVGGMYHQQGKSLAMMEPAIERIARLIGAARDAGVLPIYIQNQWLANHRAASAPWLHFMVVKNKMDPARDGCTVRGTWGAEIVEAIKPEADDVVVQKWRSSAFVGTNLDMVLRNNAIQSIVVTGALTEGCVDSTVRDAHYYDYYVALVEDGVASYDDALHNASLTILRNRVEVTTAEAVMAAWRRNAQRKHRLGVAEA